MFRAHHKSRFELRSVVCVAVSIFLVILGSSGAISSSKVKYVGMKAVSHHKHPLPRPLKFAQVSWRPLTSSTGHRRSIGVKCSPETPADIPEEVQEQIEANSQAVIDKMARLFGGNNFEFGLDEDSVAYVDDLIDRNRRTWIREGSAERMMSMLGSYLGEAIINEYGGKWVQGYGVEIEEGFVAQPMVKVGKRIVNGIEEDSIAAFFNIVGTKLEQIRSDADE